MRRGERLDPELLRRLYVDEQVSAVALSKKFGTSRASITKWLQDAGVELRNMSPHLQYPMRTVVGEEEIKVDEKYDGSPINRYFLILECGHRKNLPTYSVSRQAPIPITRPVMGQTTYRCKPCFEKGES